MSCIINACIFHTILNLTFILENEYETSTFSHFHTYLFQLFPFYFLLIIAFKFSKKIYFIPFVFI